MNSDEVENENSRLRQELVSESYRRRNWKGIALAVLVILATIAIIVVTVVFTNKTSSQTEGTLDFEDVISGYYDASSFNGTFVSENEVTFSDEYSNYVLYNLESKSHTVLMTNETSSNFSVQRYNLSPTKEYLLLTYSITKVFRHTYNAKYKIYNIATKEVSDVNDDVGDKFLQYVQWGPNGDYLVYVYENNIYYMKSLKDKPQKITDDGQKDVIFNGIPDWVYEEEVLSSNNAIWWSPNGTRLCYASFNDSLVDTMDYMWYGSYQDTKNVYPQLKSIRYPKPGRANPTATLYVVDLSSPEKKVQVVPPNNIRGEHYFTTLKWLDQERLLVVWVPRIQVNASFAVCSAGNAWKCTENTLVQSEGWVDFYDPIVSTEDSYFLKLPGENSFEHLAVVSLNDSTRRFLTKGNFEVTNIHDVINDRVYYTRTGKDQPNVRDFASISVSGEGGETCHTCGSGNNCTYNSVKMGIRGNQSYYVWTCGGPSVPYVTVRSMSHQNVLTWTTNEKLKSRLVGQVLPKTKTLRVPVARGNDAIVKLFLPDDFQESRKYPILVSVYGGPSSQSITDAFGVGWGSYLATVKKYIYAQIDGRGSAYRGDKLRFEIFKHLGTAEIEDQIAVVRYLAKKTKFVDGNRAAIWGWSYGGYASSMALATGNDTFKCAASVAPVTSWYYYDSVYTERYMLRPQDNEASYNASMVLTKAENFKGKKFLLIHGTADDNVHLQQSMMLIQSLSLEGILFNTHFYPDQDHSISKYTSNLYHTLQRFFDGCFQ